MIESDLVKKLKEDIPVKIDNCRWSFICFSLQEIGSKSECDPNYIKKCKTKGNFDYHPHTANVI